MKSTMTLKKRLAVLCVAVAVVAVGGIVARGLYVSHQAQQKAATAKAFTETVDKLSAVYATPVAANEKLSAQPVADQEVFINNAAQYYGVDSDTGNGAAPEPLEIVGACMRQKNIELAQNYRDQSQETIMSHDSELKHLKQMIAQECYARYSPDGALPDKFSESIHNH